MQDAGKPDVGALTYQDLKDLQIAPSPWHAVAHVPRRDTYAERCDVERCDAMHRATLAHTQARNVRRVREELGLTQEQFGRLLGWDRTRANKLESGKHTLSPETIDVLSEKTGRDPFWFHVPHGEDDDDLPAVVGS